MSKIQTPYQAGKDAAINGPNTINCNFRWFATPEMTKAWERGNKVGLRIVGGEKNEKV